MRVMTSKVSEASEAKIYIILSKEWKINRYGPWIFHRNIFNHKREEVLCTSMALTLHRDTWSYDVGIATRLC